MKSLFVILIVLLTAVGPVAANPDSIRREATDSVRFTPGQLIVPGALITVGALGVGVKPLRQARIWVNNEIGVHNCSPADDIIRYLPLAGYLTLDFAGVRARRPFMDRLVAGATGAIIATALCGGLKLCVNEARPGGTGRSSFPSGHTTTAFLGAELLRLDYGPLVGAGGYLAASTVGAMRILNGRHWLNDVLAGAGIGILSARAALWLLPFNRRWLGLNRRRGEAAVVVPAFSPADGSAMMTVALIL